MRASVRMTRGGLGDARGLALPAALIALMILSSLMLAFALLAQTEPVIAANHARVAQARALAESGLERGIWALNRRDGTPAGGGLAVPAASMVAAAPYDGQAFIRITGAGGFTLKITGSTADEALIESVGWTSAPGAPQTSAHRKITATLQRLTDLARNAPCALCVKAALTVSGASTIDGRPSGGSACGAKGGTFTRQATSAGATSTIYGADGNLTANETTDIAQDQPAPSFDAFTLTRADLDTLKALARANATYYRGRVTFDDSNRLKNGVVFVDTASGRTIPPDQSQQDPPDFAVVDVRGAPFVDPAGFHGVLVVNGDLSIAGDMTLRGLLYAVSGFSYAGSGGGSINGLVISHGIRDGEGASVAGSSTITFDCAGARGAGYVPAGWFLRAGTYKEVSD